MTMTARQHDCQHVHSERLMSMVPRQSAGTVVDGVVLISC